jgi:Co/Zn/Cd efflux system component
MDTHEHAHPHPSAAGEPSDRAGSRRALSLTLALTSAFTIAEVVGGLLTGSLALLADAAHMLSDDLSLGVALFAVWLAERQPTPKRTFGFKRAEILAALFNGVTLIAISIWIFVEAYDRFQDPPEIPGGDVAVPEPSSARRGRRHRLDSAARMSDLRRGGHDRGAARVSRGVPGKRPGGGPD